MINFKQLLQYCNTLLSGHANKAYCCYHHLLYHINHHDQDFLSTYHCLFRCYGNRICLHGNLPRALPRWAWPFFPIITRHEMKVHKIVTHPFPRQKRSRPPVTLLLQKHLIQEILKRKNVQTELHPQHNRWLIFQLSCVQVVEDRNTPYCLFSYKPSN